MSYIKDPYDYFKYEKKYKVDDAIQLVGERFKEHGWEGDGSIGIIWLPPFIEIGVEDTWGTYIWHVKQDNDGISFLASDVPLDFNRIRAQNTEVESARDLRPISIIETDVEWFIKGINDVEANLRKSQSFLSPMSSDTIAETIKKNLNIHYQGVLIRYFQEFLEECYLRILIEAIANGNPHKIKLRKSDVKIDFTYHTTEFYEENDEETINAYLTIRMFISDLWKAYKWEPYKNKTDMLFKSIDYTMSADLSYMFKKHVIIRNCMQHHQERLDRDSLKQLGRNDIEVQGVRGIYHIKVWEAITIVEEEVYLLCASLREFAENFHEHVKQRIPTKHYRTQYENSEDN